MDLLAPQLPTRSFQEVELALKLIIETFLDNHTNHMGDPPIHEDTSGNWQLTPPVRGTSSPQANMSPGFLLPKSSSSDPDWIREEQSVLGVLLVVIMAPKASEGLLHQLQAQSSKSTNDTRQCRLTIVSKYNKKPSSSSSISMPAMRIQSNNSLNCNPPPPPHHHHHDPSRLGIVGNSGFIPPFPLA
ncbi:hypothetical protein TCAL_14628 [Tigriopus californicus]|uniref:Uncharacterized protein n=1 Tax=Tigriopus californicus TaxID=6832 RepID=A0A553P8A9_TIGCA|nr:hypothetical protein TCAL_14628 [Tigriopus californicus]